MPILRMTVEIILGRCNGLTGALLFLILCHQPVFAENSVQGVWHGTLGRSVVTACFDSNNQAAYYYQRSRIDIKLIKNGADWDESFKGETTGRWHIERDVADHLSGTWTNAKGNSLLNILLTRIDLPDEAAPCASAAYTSAITAKEAVVATHNGLWTWMGGAKKGNAFGVYGQRGVTSVSNQPGARSYAMAWKDARGRFWLFGGEGPVATEIGELLNDLWVYDPGTGKWTWVAGSKEGNALGIYGVQGTPSANNRPGARWESATWTDAHGKLWLYGGEGVNAAGVRVCLNDLWEFDSETLQWTWIMGDGISSRVATAMPGSAEIQPEARMNAVSWVDSSGMFWLFGGATQSGAVSDQHDLWKFDPASRHWTAVGGHLDATIPVRVATSPILARMEKRKKRKLHSARLLVPRRRSGATAWVDQQDQLWLFGGYGGDEQGRFRYYQDLWQFDVDESEWGLETDGKMDGNGIYGIRDISDGASHPGARGSALSWVSTDGKLWLFGGSGFDSADNQTHYLNDLWFFDPLTERWTWISGSQTGGQMGIYGLLGVASIKNQPGAREGAVGWLDAKGNLWLFGGVGDAEQRNEYLNDLWRFQP